MSDAPPPPTDMQFDQAEFKGEPAALACGSCAAPIRDTYYQVGEAIACERCRRRLEWDATHGSAIGRFLKATLLGALAAGVGAGIYYAVRALTGYEFGLIAVVVGLFVGGAVRMGSGHRGGVPYQLLAMFLTYTSIVSTYIPEIVKGFREAQAADAAPAPAPAGNVAAVGATSGEAPAAAATAAPPMGPLMTVIMGVAVVAFAFAAPFLMGFENIIGLIIIGIGLFEAWKMNRKPDRTVTGPFRIESAR